MTRTRRFSLLAALIVAVVSTLAIVRAQIDRIDGGIPRVSPDGKRIAYFSTRDGSPGLWVMNADGSGAHKIGSAELRHGNWTPDSRRLVVARTNGDSAGIYAVDVVSGELKLLANERGATSAALSPDGSRLAFSAGQRPNFGIFVMRSDGTARRALTTEAGVHFGVAWSPDGTSIAYFKSGAGQWVVKADGTGLHQIAPEGQGATWSPDGKWIAYGKAIMAPRKPGEQWAQPRRADIIIVRPDGSDRRVLTQQTEDWIVETPSWFPDSQTLAVQVMQDGVTRLHVLDLNGKLVRGVSPR